MTDRRLAIAAWESLFRAQHEVFDEINDAFHDGELAQAEYDVLLTVTRGDGYAARLRDVTANMLISQPSVSRLVDRMVVRGLITKTPDPADGRGAILIATAEGAAAFRRLATIHGRAIADRMSVLSDDELSQLRTITAKLRNQR
ncbi:MarR family winged helix-turn-helix transcriptional regulator [Microbacterium invictum]|uniref:DNA-binding MarR family transcriptional regulator n=1 Tax=Microbacterium invictum TaxID=515415 RepID=A0AA40VP49_9MICO|nr:MULTISPECIES: MarR family transcriptional regulator [Microbacterium]MBB4141484.1 DNA-binding MarR family transcriptional regulator [Microbacterium invictum]